ncbi:MAG: glycine zipper 2TM domain-containing protein [Salinisphaeraceae bacterium]|nr:glycine zipper 2TM domain-containing protein [Salinisphaeraceae bacterium]
MNNLLIAGAVAAPLIAGSAVGGYALYQDQQEEDNRARIVSVAEVTTVEKVPVSRQECWKEKVVKVEKKETESAGWKLGSTVLGAAIGGAIGHQIGDGRGQDVATVAGAAIGGKIGHDVYKEEHKPKRVEKVTYEPRCKTVTDYKSVEKPNGYDVTYEYKGQTYTTHMDEAPQGEYIPVETEIRLQTKS